MKKYSFYKTVQLILTIGIAAAVIFFVFIRADLFHLVANNSEMKLLAGALWAVLIISFIFIFLDFVFFFNYIKDYKEMELAASSDPVSGIANRFSCDMLIEKYLDKPLPENIGVAVLNITNAGDINRIYGHLQGNLAIKDFSNILRLSSSDLCFVGRNGGINFLAIFENSDAGKMKNFLERVSQRVTSYNRDIKNIAIEYNFGTAFSGSDTAVADITGLISLATTRARES